MTTHHTVEAAIESMKLGAFDYILKDQSTPQELLAVMDKAVAAHRIMSERVEFEEAVTSATALIGRSRAMQKVYKDIGRLAAKPIPVLIRGEPGSQKELVARAVHQHSDRKAQPFITVNCIGVPETQLESELFGHEPGAFKDAVTRHIGRFEQLSGGTIFLNEIGDMTSATLYKLFVLLQRKTIQRLGCAEDIRADVRIIVGTNVKHPFWKDPERYHDPYYLFDILTAAAIDVPGLRERLEDIPKLAEYFIRRHSAELDLARPGITQDAVECLQQHDWPGNVSEFEKVIRRALLLSNGFTINEEMIRNILRTPPVAVADQHQSPRPRVPDHELLRRIGAGGFGEVWLARSVLGTYRAVKVIRRANFEDDEIYEKEFQGIQKFEPVSRENEGFVDILQVGRNDKEAFYYYVMEVADDQFGKGEIDVSAYVAKTLSTEIANRRRLPLNECLRIGSVLTAALGHLHEGGLVHRDIKPSNIILVNGVPKLADIGLVTTATGITQLGTLGYIAPEGPGRPQADLYSFGMVLYEISTGKDRLDFPVLPTDLTDDMLKLNAIILKACEYDRAKRYESALQMHEDLVRLQQQLANY